MFPDFIGIGAQKAGTTWLYHNLCHHLEIWMPNKELHYFDRRINREDGTDEWYAAKFEPGRGRVTGEITPAYSILDRDMIAHISAIMPRTKIIFSMRNPLERIWSQASMHFDTRYEKAADAATEDELVRFLDHTHVPRAQSNYLKTLENWQKFYPAERIFIVFMEDIHFHPERLMQNLYGFLGVNPIVEWNVARHKVHSRGSSRMRTAFAARLARIYCDQLETLNGMFGGYASFWLYCADRLLNAPSPGDFIPYPMWESSFWSEWTRGSRVQFQSGPLSEICRSA